MELYMMLVNLGALLKATMKLPNTNEIEIAILSNAYNVVSDKLEEVEKAIKLRK